MVAGICAPGRCCKWCYGVSICLFCKLRTSGWNIKSCVLFLRHSFYYRKFFCCCPGCGESDCLLKCWRFIIEEECFSHLVLLWTKTTFGESLICSVEEGFDDASQFPRTFISGIKAASNICNVFVDRSSVLTGIAVNKNVEEWKTVVTTKFLNRIWDWFGTRKMVSVVDYYVDVFHVAAIGVWSEVRNLKNIVLIGTWRC